MLRDVPPLNPPPHPPPPSPPPPVYDTIAVLNDAAHLDFRTVYNQSVHENDDSIDPYSELVIDSNYYDMYTLPSILNDNVSPIFLSINIQSLMSKYEELQFFITDMSRKKVYIDVIAIQEVWEIQQPELLPSLVFKPLFTSLEQI